jgi:hypothetical protein
LDPLTGNIVMVNPESGRSFTSYGNSVNVGPMSALEQVDESELDVDTKSRAARVAANNATTDRGDDMADTTDISNVSAAPIPSKNNRISRLAKRPKNEAKPLGTTTKKATKSAKTPKAEKAPRELKPCACGCGEKTGGYFVPGHDARFKSALLKIERGDETKEKLLKKSVIDKYTWKKRGKGEIPTTNYKGEKHNGYDKE